jgi:hypothetical protein
LEQPLRFELPAKHAEVFQTAGSGVITNFKYSNINYSKALSGHSLNLSLVT